MIDAVQKVLKSPLLVLVHFFQHKPFCYFMSDRTWLKLMFYAYHGQRLNLDSPLTFNEKLQWLKLYDRKPEYRMMSDKFAVRKFVSEIIGEDHLIPLLGVWNAVDEIDFDSLPNQFVLKCNHDSAGLIVCKDKSKLDVAKAKRKLRKCLKRDYFWAGREDNYRVAQKKIIAEKYMTDGDKDDLTDYKFYCFNGTPKFVQVDMNRYTNHVDKYYDMDWHEISVDWGCGLSPSLSVCKPNCFEEMKLIAKKLSKNLLHVRVDMYLISGKIYFGELTFHSGGGNVKVNPISYDYEWGSYLEI